MAGKNDDLKKRILVIAAATISLCLVGYMVYVALSGNSVVVSSGLSSDEAIVANVAKGSRKSNNVNEVQSKQYGESLIHRDGVIQGAPSTVELPRNGTLDGVINGTDVTNNVSGGVDDTTYDTINGNNGNSSSGINGLTYNSGINGSSNAGQGGQYFAGQGATNSSNSNGVNGAAYNGTNGNGNNGAGRTGQQPTGQNANNGNNSNGGNGTTHNGVNGNSSAGQTGQNGAGQSATNGNNGNSNDVLGGLNNMFVNGTGGEGASAEIAQNMRPEAYRVERGTHYDYKSVSDAELALKTREVQAKDKEVSSSTLLVYSKAAGLGYANVGTIGPAGGGSGGGQGRGSRASNPSHMNSVSGNVSGNATPSYLTESDRELLENVTAKGQQQYDALMTAMNAQQASQSKNDPRFGAISRPMVSNPGQLSDMRIGGLPEIVIPEGKFIDCVVVNNIETSFHDNPVTALVSRDLLDRTGKYILIPQGTRVLGLAFRVENIQSGRMFISFHRAIFPDGRSAYFPERRMPEGFNIDGVFGVNAKVNNHWLKRFGAAIALGVIEGLSYSQSEGVRVNQDGSQTMSGDSMAAMAMGRTFSDIGRRMVEHYSNFLPIVSIRAGTRLKLYLSEDMLLSTYAHKDRR